MRPGHELVEAGPSEGGHRPPVSRVRGEAVARGGPRRMPAMRVPRRAAGHVLREVRVQDRVRLHAMRGHVGAGRRILREMRRAREVTVPVSGPGNRMGVVREKEEGRPVSGLGHFRHVPASTPTLRSFEDCTDRLILAKRRLSCPTGCADGSASRFRCSRHAAAPDRSPNRVAGFRVHRHDTGKDDAARNGARGERRDPLGARIHRERRAARESLCAFLLRHQLTPNRLRDGRDSPGCGAGRYVASGRPRPCRV